jgi:hypothetical protein
MQAARALAKQYRSDTAAAGGGIVGAGAGAVVVIRVAASGWGDDHASNGGNKRQGARGEKSLPSYPYRDYCVWIEEDTKHSLLLPIYAIVILVIGGLCVSMFLSFWKYIDWIKAQHPPKEDEDDEEDEDCAEEVDHADSYDDYDRSYSSDDDGDEDAYLPQQMEGGEMTDPLAETLLVQGGDGEGGAGLEVERRGMLRGDEIRAQRNRRRRRCSGTSRGRVRGSAARGNTADTRRNVRADIDDDIDPDEHVALVETQQEQQLQPGPPPAPPPAPAPAPASVAASSTARQEVGSGRRGRRAGRRSKRAKDPPGEYDVVML